MLKLIKVTLLGTALAWAITSFPAMAQGGAVISQSEIDSARVTRIYMGQSRELIAVNQQEGSAVRQAFEANVIGRSAEQIKAHWSRLVFTGRAAELRQVESDEAVLEYVRSNPGTIGYISDASKADDLNILLEF
ncbi:hypothetical protein CWE12_00910 [Aliidiomarina sedimenti]|uniref:Phosphate ABC transporter substrate-binding protein n=1 Tax=Aliidiomarina sedimenti TaxID=1933879 RepID=A0ABY0C147_9GAMM|nr:hypothetical protein [Aliidiomarina sedimenti]RUO31590.1 hypothetical protein CWE12_00910 [Aliidiomarina sedimenti]